MSRRTSVFWNRDERRPRALWRLLLQTLMLLVASLCLLPVGRLFAAHPLGVLIAERMPYLLMIVTVWLATRLLDRRSIGELGLRMNRGWWLDCCFGLLLGLLLIAGVFTAATLGGWIQFRTVPVVGELGLPLAAALLCVLLEVALVAVGEEVWCRGYQLRNLADGLRGRRIGPRAALGISVVLTAAVFSGLHLRDSNSSILSAVNTFLGGVLLGLGLACTGRLGLPIGFHLAWNFAQGGLFGFPVSGKPPRVALLTIDHYGSTLWTGGAYGPEGGLLGTAAFLTAIALTLAWVAFLQRSGRPPWRPSRFKRSPVLLGRHGGRPLH